MSRYDAVVTPRSSGRISEPGATDITLQDVCWGDLSGHVGMAADANVNLLIRRALDPENPPAMRYRLVVPMPY